MKKVGVIDDDEDNGIYLKALLEETFCVEYFESWKEAKNPFTLAPPEIILLDISMPEMSGQKVLSEIRKIPSLANTRVVALTGYAMDGDKEKFMKQGFDGYFAKPLLDPEPLFQMIDEKISGPQGDR